jgi:hypothetical protein
MGRAGRAYALKHWERERVLKSTEQRLAGVLGGTQALSGSPAVEVGSMERSGS